MYPPSTLVVLKDELCSVCIIFTLLALRHPSPPPLFSVLLTWLTVVESVQFGLGMWNMLPLERMNQLYLTLALQRLFNWTD